MRKWISYISYLLSAICVGVGFYKLFVYENNLDLPFGYGFSKNAYVESDALNMIINSNMAIAFFVLSGVLVIIGIGCRLIDNKN
jgi:hypothetical protein